MVDSGGFIPSFNDAARLRAYADVHRYSLQDEEPILHYLDWVAAWVKAPAVPVNCGEVLAAWNLFSDVARSMPDKGSAFEYLDSQPIIYYKLFWGNNLPPMTRPASLAQLQDYICRIFSAIASQVPVSASFVQAMKRITQAE